jgi:starvation-inducible DNA-binding protein
MCVRDEGDNRITSRQSTTGDGHGIRPLLVQHGRVIQAFSTPRLLPIALSHEARLHSCQLLNQILADTMILYSHAQRP